MNDAFSRGLVDHLHCLGGVGSRGASLVSRRKDILDASAELSTYGAVPDASLFVLTVPLDLTLDVGHWGAHLVL